MKTNKKILFTSIISIGVLSAFSVMLFDKSLPVFSSPSGTDFTLAFNNQKISNRTTSSTEEISANVLTGKGNQIQIKSANVVAYNSGWQTILPTGYFYNPLTDSSYNNKISGITSIRFESLGSETLTLHYGSTINNSEVIYSHSKTLSPNVTYSFDNESPEYFYIKNENSVSVDIDDFSITYSCEEGSYEKQNLTVLMIGNSFADDTVFYTSRVASSYGININLYDAYIAGCTVDQHYTNLNNGNTAYSMRHIENNDWVYDNSMSLGDIIDSNTWDIITFQQASAEVGLPDCYSNLSNLVSAVRTRVGDGPKFYWHQTWAYDSEYHDSNNYFANFNNNQVTMYNAINSCYTSQVAPLHVFEDIIPAGTAVQNLRTSYMGDTFTRDGKHMSSVHGRYLLSLNFLSTLYDVDLDMSPCNYLPPEVDNSFKGPAYEAVRNAHKNPLACTQSVYTSRDLGGYDLSNYTEIDAELVGCSYWNSTDSTNYNKRQGNVSGTSNQYVSTKRFTSSTLPVGSLVVIGDSFGIRPEAWVDDSQQSSRPNEIYPNLLVIDNSFFDGYEYRAFNIFKAGKPYLANENQGINAQYHQIFDGFHIYVPNSSMSGLTPKGTNDRYNTDKVLFQNNLLNIDAFERMHLDPITGFFKCDSYYTTHNSYVDDTAKKFVCTRPFYSANDDLPENTVLVVDSGYQWRSDYWKDYGKSPDRPSPVATSLTRLDSSFWTGIRRRTFNVNSTNNSQYVGQNYIDYINHFRIYIPVSDDIEIEPVVLPDSATMTALGYATVNSMAASMLGRTDIPVLITLHGDSVDKVKVEVNGIDAGATGYTFNKSTGALSITTTGSASGYTYGTITGTVNRDAGTISNISLNGTLSSFVTNNGSVTCSESWHDRCNYSSYADAQAVWQRWYMTSSWQANAVGADFITVNSIYKLDNDHTMGLRIANNSYGKTRFTLKEDFNGGAGFAPKGISIWYYNPNGAIYGRFRIYVYTTASTVSDGHAVPSGSYTQVYETTSADLDSDNAWKNVKLGMSGGTIYNVSFYFETSSSAFTYIYLGHVSFY